MRLNRLAAPSLLAGMLLFFTTSHAAGLQGRSGDYEVQVLTPATPARTFTHRGDTWVLGQLGERYVIRIINHTNRRVEAVASVDGRDVLDGKPADFVHKRGYLIPAHGHLDIDGFRISQAEVAAFRFSRVKDSYAARMGEAGNVGVIGVALFPERYVPPPRPREHIISKKRSEAAPPASAGAPAAPGARDHARSEERPGLGTEFGEAVESRVQTVEFMRADPTRPAVVLGLRYNDRKGLIAQGIEVDGSCKPDDAELRRTASPFPDSQYALPPPGWTR
ncbi:MAG: hypothetical protein WBV82_33500 [Myxococcaceae bacterium]